MRVAMIAPILPDRTGDGLAMRMGSFAEGLARLGSLDVILVPAAGPALSINAFMRELGARVHLLEAARRPGTHFALLSRLRDPQERLAAFKAYGSPSLSSCLPAATIAKLNAVLSAIKLILYIWAAPISLLWRLRCRNMCTPRLIWMRTTTSHTASKRASPANAGRMCAQTGWSRRASLAID